MVEPGASPARSSSDCLTAAAVGGCSPKPLLLLLLLLLHLRLLRRRRRRWPLSGTVKAVLAVYVCSTQIHGAQGTVPDVVSFQHACCGAGYGVRQVPCSSTLDCIS
jgi:hypothetical protein